MPVQRRILIGSGLAAGGCALLPFTTGLLSMGDTGGGFLLIAAGVFLLYRAFLPGGREVNVFSGTLLTLLGVFFVLQQSVLTQTDIRTLWPVFVTSAGLALVAYGFRRGDRYLYSLVIPGVAVVLLSFLFLLFSLDLVQASLASLAVRWWPVLLVPLGVLILLPGRAGPEGDEAPGGEEPPDPLDLIEDDDLEADS
ncbi:hypothetical protein AU468_13160 [Alkalispirochaeta sphaeroplastigenens]|uniref:LiaI-LiaF-like transmembrane region domain-containing protein n=1 Tax=Alkalispirochaeta sphaeroplastigenens TaxID=1187066 RepID=A0A2S4JG41_9SPIO|nr:DUF5668 domain-containing protein [Alkalispirochaeta sphaeroplastigenens]POQ98527.1 hypothetical protein AU468_13160 [Alkalispirochaeta sphaeroplastigenens]